MSWLPRVMQDFYEKHIMHIKNTIKNFNNTMQLQLYQALAAFKAQRRLQLMVCLGTSDKVIYTTTGNVTQAIFFNIIMKLFKYFVA